MDIKIQKNNRLVLAACPVSQGRKKCSENVRYKYCFQDVVQSAKACQYAVTVLGRSCNGQSGRFVNKNTSVVLSVSHGTDDDGDHYVKVERQPMDEAQ